MSNTTTTNRQLKRLTRFALYALVAAVVVAAWGIVTRIHARTALESAALAQSVPVVEVVTPRHSAHADELVLPGDVQAYIDAPIYARTSGYLKRWYADIGTQVKAGQLLAVIETPEVDAQYRQAKADLATAEANNRLSQTTAARDRELIKTDLVAQQDVDNALGDADAKAAQLESARQNLQRLEQMQSFNRIIAPFDGIVTASRPAIGALVCAGSTSGQELFHMSSTHRLRVYVQVPQVYAGLIRSGQPAELTVVERPGHRYAAKVVSTAKAIDPSTRTLLTELAADNVNEELLPGAYSQVHLQLPAGLNSWRLPSNTLLFRGDGLHVATVDAHDQVQLNTVSMGRDFGTEIEILAGVSGQDRVILNPPDSILAGAIVKVRAAQ